ncbi:MAG: hypothetical protein AB8B46_02455 [Candidatus Midichloriaceae bacterium]
MSETKKSNVLIRRLVKYAVVILTVYLIITEVIPWAWRFNMYGASKFDAELWTKTHIGKHTGGTVQDWMDYRCSMYNDLTKNHLKKGMKLEEVTDMLGDYRSVDYCTNKKVKCISYQLGSCLNGALSKSLIVKYFGFYDRQFMYVCFDKDGKIVSNGKSLGKNKYSYLECDGKENTILCEKYSGDCTKTPWISNTGRVIYDEVDFEQW